METWPLSRFKPYAGNARTHDERHVGEIAASMQAFGRWSRCWPIPAARSSQVMGG